MDVTVTAARGALTAAAARYTERRTRQPARSGNTGWQTAAWDLFDVTPEVRFAASWIAGGMSGARLFAGRRAPDGTITPVPDDHPAAELVAQIAGGPDGQPEMLAAFGPHLVVAGEAWIVIRPTDNDTYDWRVLSCVEVRRQAGGLTAEIDGEDVDVPPYDPDSPGDTDTPIAIRVWQPHPRRYIEADSPVRSCLTVLEELRLLNAAVAAIARSRITGRGVLLVPQGTRFPTAPGQADAEDDLIETFMQVAETAIREPESAAATVPIILEVPPQAIGQIEHLTFESSFDELAIKLRDEAIRRFAAGADIPAEIILGLADSNHWSAWLLQEQAVRLGVEPKLRLVAHALTDQWLRPLLDAQGVDDADECLVWFDTSQLRTRANKAQVALEAYKIGLISDQAARREVGFDEGDAPEPAPAKETPDNNNTGEDGNNVTTLPVEDTTSEPDTLPASSAPDPGMVAAIDGLIYHALSTTGMRILTKPACPRSERSRAREIVASEVHVHYAVDGEQVDAWRLLDGAWTRVPEVATRYHLNGPCLTDTLDDYVRALVASRTPYCYDDVPRLLRMADCQLAAA